MAPSTRHMSRPGDAAAAARRRADNLENFLAYIHASLPRQRDWKRLLEDDPVRCLLLSAGHVNRLAKVHGVCDFAKWNDTGFERVGRKSKQDHLSGSLKDDAADLTTIQEMIARSSYPGEDNVDDDRQLGKLLLMRSKVLLKRSIGSRNPILNFEAILRDLKLARDAGGLDDYDLSDLFFIAGVCQSKLRSYDDATTSMVESAAFVGAAHCSEAKCTARKAKIVEAVKTIALRKKEAATGPIGGARRAVPRLSSVNDSYPSLSGSVRVKTDQEKGRKIVAESEIKPGEIILIEKSIFQLPYILKRSVALTCCHHCMAHSDNLLPCPDCSDVMFCSMTCQAKACGSYHAYECRLGIGKILTLFRSECDSLDAPLYRNVFCPLRVLFSHPLEYYASLPLLEGPDYDSAQDPYTEDDERNFWNLETKIESLKQTEEVSPTLFPFLSICFELVKSSGYIPKNDPEAEKLVAKALIHASRAFELNWFTGNKPFEEHLICPADSAYLPAPVKSGSTYFYGVFNTASLANHSCVNNTGYFTVDDKLLFVAKRPIMPGEEITISYGTSFNDEEVSERQDYLQRLYGFTCSCLACFKGWGPDSAELARVRDIVRDGPEAWAVLRELLLKEEDLAKVAESCYGEQYKTLLPVEAGLDGGRENVYAVTLWTKYCATIELLYTTFIQLQ